MKFTYQMPTWKNKGDAPSEELKTKGFVAEDRAPANIFNYFWALITDAIKEIQTKLTSIDDTKADKAELIPVITDYSELNEEEYSTKGTVYQKQFVFQAKGKIFSGRNDTDVAICASRIYEDSVGTNVYKQQVTVLRGGTVLLYERSGTRTLYYPNHETGTMHFRVDWTSEFELVDSLAKNSSVENAVNGLYTYGTEDLTAGTSELETGKLYFVYE